MKIKTFYSQLSQSPTKIKLALTAALVAWGMLCMIPLAGDFFFVWPERAGQTSGIRSGPSTPVIALEPASGSAGTPVTVRGEGWPAGSLVFIYLTAPDEIEIPDYPIAKSITDFEGRFMAHFVFPRRDHWENQDWAMVIARTDDGGLPVQASFDLAGSVSQTEKIPASPAPTTPPP